MLEEISLFSVAIIELTISSCIMQLSLMDVINISILLKPVIKGHKKSHSNKRMAFKSYKNRIRF
jgi:hypothetical protein